MIPLTPDELNEIEKRNSELVKGSEYFYERHLDTDILRLIATIRHLETAVAAKDEEWRQTVIEARQARDQADVALDAERELADALAESLRARERELSPYHARGLPSFNEELLARYAAARRKP